MSLLLLFGGSETPPVPGGQEYRTGGHSEAVHASSIVSAIFVAAAAIIGSIGKPAFAGTLPQDYDNQQSYVKTVFFEPIVVENLDWVKPTVLTTREEFEVRQGRVDHVLIQQFIAPPNRAKSWTGPQQYGNEQGRVDHTLIQQFINPPNRPKAWTLPQPFDVAQGSNYHTLIQQFIAPPNRPSTSWTLPQPYDVQQGSSYGPLAEAVVSPPTRPQTSWTAPQQYGVDQGSVYHTLIQQFIAPPIRPAIETLPQVPEQVYSTLFKAWAYIILDNPQLRAITTQAEVPQNAPSSVYHTLIQQFIAPPNRPKTWTIGQEYVNLESSVTKYFFEPVVVTDYPPTNPEYHHGTHRLEVLQSNNRSSIWSALPTEPVVPPTTPYPPVNPRYEYGTHERNLLQSGNRTAFYIPWQVQLYEPYFIALDVIGERDEDYSLRPSSVFHQRPAEGVPYVPPDDHPVTLLTRPQQYDVDQGQVYHQHLNALVETLAIRDTASFTLPQTFQVRNDSQVYHYPPLTVQPPKHYWAVLTIPQPVQVYEVNRSKVAARNAATLPSVPITSIDDDLVGIEIDIYQGTLTPEVIRFMGRVVTEAKLEGATAQLEPPFDFSLALVAGETLVHSSVVSTVYSGVDPNPAYILKGHSVISGNRVTQMMRSGVVGCVYELLCTVTTSLAQTLQQSTYFYVEPDLP